MVYRKLTLEVEVFDGHDVNLVEGHLRDKMGQLEEGYDVNEWHLTQSPPYGPRWYTQVADAFDRISVMPLVIEADQVSEMYEQARCGAESIIGDDDNAIEIEAAERTAAAVGVLAYGVSFISNRPPDTLAEIETDYNKRDQQPLTPEQRDAYIDSGLDEETWRKRNPTHHDYLLVRFDVTELSDGERDALAGEVIVQAEGSDDHPSIPDPELTWVQDAPKRKVVDIVKEAYFHDPTISDEDYGRLMEEADEQDQRNEWAAEAAPSREE